MAEETLFEEVQATGRNIEHFVEENKQKLLIGGGILIALIAAILFIFLKFLPERELKAERAMYHAEMNFKKEAYELALNGDASGKGFLAVQKDFSFTKSANLCNYYIGISYLNLKKYNEAITYLDKFSTKDPLIGAARYNAMGDAYAELKKTDDAIKYYKKAATFSDNEVYAPYYLLKAGNYCEYLKKYKEANELYQEIKEKYPLSETGRDIEKYIARVQVNL